MVWIHGGSFTGRLVPTAAEQQSLDGGPGIRGQGVAGALVWVIEPAAVVAAAPLCVLKS
jgi:hypothetical protein